MVGVRLMRSSSQIPGYPHIHIFAEPCSTSHETTDTLAGMTDGAQYSQTLHERSVLTADMRLEAQQRTTRPLVFALTTALDLLGIERHDEKTITLTNAEKLYVHVTASDLGDEGKGTTACASSRLEDRATLEPASRHPRAPIPVNGIGFRNVDCETGYGTSPAGVPGTVSPGPDSVPETSVCEIPRRAGHRLHPPERMRHPSQDRTGRLTKPACSHKTPI